MKALKKKIYKYGFVSLLFVAATAWFILARGPIQIGPDIKPGSPVVILLHSYGVDGNKMVPLANELSAAAPDVTFLIPTAQHQVGVYGRSWYARYNAKTAKKAKKGTQVVARKDRKEAIAQVMKIVDDLRKQGVHSRDITLGGFSQGADVALDAVLDPAGSRLGGLIFLSGGRMKFDLSRLGKRRQKLNAFVSHGDSDYTVEDRVYNRLVMALSENKHRLKRLRFDGGHQIAPPVRKNLRKWVASRIN